MAVATRFWAYLLGAALLWAGIALGAESQLEEYLEPSLAAGREDASRGAGGNLVVLTAFLAAGGAGLAVGLLSRAATRDRMKGVGAVIGGVYLLTVLVQSAWPNVDTCTSEADVCQSLTFSMTSIASNQPAIASLFLPVFAAFLATVFIVGSGLRRLFPPEAVRLATSDPSGAPDAPDAPQAFLARFVGAVALAAPFLAISAWGNLRLLVSLPEGEAGLGIYQVALPMAAIASLAVLVLACVQAWHWGAFVRNGRLGATVEEVWRMTSRALWFVVAAIPAIALMAFVMPATALDALESGRTFTVTLRGHTQFLLLLVVPLLPLLSLQRKAYRTLENHEGHTLSLEVSGLHGEVARLYAAVGATLVGSALAVFLMEGALWAWLAGLVPVALLGTRLPAAAAAPTLFVTAFALWGIGNTVAGAFDSNTGRLVVVTGAGVLALWRAAGAVFAGAAVFRLALATAPRTKPRRGWPATACALAFGALLLLELPLAAWVVTRGEGQSVAIGSLLSGQALAVRVTMHIMAAGLSVAAAQAVARAWRPEWFDRMPPPLAMPRRAKAPA